MAKKKSERILALKIVRAGGHSSHGFVWPLIVGATVTAPDWRPTKECSGGLHAWKDGEGDVSACSYHADEGTIGLVVDADPADVVDLGDKIKMRECVILFVGTVREAAAWLSAKRPKAKVIYGSQVSGDGGTSTSGDRGTSTSGDRGTSTSGYCGTSTSGSGGTIAVLYYDRTASVYRKKIAECDPNGPVKPWRRYKLDDAGAWVDCGEVPESERPGAVLSAAYAKVKK